MAFYLASAFALSMIPQHATCVVNDISDSAGAAMGEYFRDHDIQSIVGHQSTADYMSAILEIPVPVNRESVLVDFGDSIYVCTPGVRLQEGQVLTRAELEAIPCRWWVVFVKRIGE